MTTLPGANAPEMGRLGISLALSMVAIVLAAMVIYGWHTGDPGLIQVRHTFAPMQYNTALCLLLSALGTTALIGEYDRIARVCSAAIMLIAGLTLLQHLVGGNFGIDEFFVHDDIHVRTTHPGRMAPNTAACYVLFGIAAISISLKSAQRDWPIYCASVTLAIVLAMALIALLAYAADLDASHGWARFMGMAVHTAAGFCAVSVALVAVIFVRRGKSPGSRFVLLAILVGAGGGLLSLLGWTTLYADQRAALDRQSQLHNEMIAIVIEKEFASTKAAIERMAERWSAQPEPNRGGWSLDALSYLRDLAGMTDVRWVGRDLVVDWVEPRRARGELEGFEVSRDPAIRQLYADVTAHRERAVAAVVPTAAGLPSMVIVAAIHDERGVMGYISASFDYRTWAHHLLGTVVRNGWGVTLSEADHVLYQQGPSDLFNDAASSFEIAGHTLDVRSGPGFTAASARRSVLPVTIAGSGFILTLLLLLAIFLAARAARAATEIESSNRRLNSTLAALRAADERNRLFLEAAPDAMVISSEEGVIVRVNTQTETLFGYAHDELVGEPIGRLIPSRLRERQVRDLHAFVNDTKVGLIVDAHESFGLHRDGTEFPIEASLSVFDTTQGKMITSAVRDVSEKLRTRRHLQAANDRLTEANAAMEEFVYVVSHDLKAPLQGIDHLVDWIAEELGDGISAECEKNLHRIRERTHHLEKLIRDLLTYSRLTSEEYDVESLDIAKVISDIADVLGLRERFEVDIEIRCTEIITARTPLETVLRNLLSNAMKHHDGDTGRIKVTAEQRDGEAHFSVIDDGPGVPAAQRERVFGLFQTLKTPSRADGSGIGLTIVRRLVEKHGGRISLSEAPTRGCQVDFSWPIGRRDRSAA